MTFGERHLARPDSFPRRLSGIPWGEEELTLVIAGISFVFEGLDAGRAAVARRHWSGWFQGGGPGGRRVVTRVLRADDADFLPFPGPGGEITTDVAAESDAARLCGPLWMARVELEPSLRGTLCLPPGESAYGEGAIENYLRVLSGYALLAEGGVVVHSAAVVEKEEAHLFPASSGSGKTTLSRLSLGEGRMVLSDDMNAVVKRGGTTFVAQVPFTGDLGRRRVANGPFPLAAVHRLRKGEETASEPLGRTQALGLLFAETPYVNTDPFRQARLWDVLEDLLGGVALRVLTFSRSGPLWPAVASQVGHAHA